MRQFRQRSFTAEAKVRVRELLALGYSVEQIAEDIGITELSLRSMACRHGLSLRAGVTRIPAEVSPSCYKALIIEADRMKVPVPLFVASLLELVVKENLFKALDLEPPDPRI